MHYIYVISYYLTIYLTSLIIGSHIIEFKPRRKWACLAMILSILMLPIIIMCFSDFFATGYEPLPIYFFTIYLVCFFPVIYGTQPGESNNHFVSYIFNWFLIFIIGYLWNMSLSIDVSAFVALFLPNIIPVRALFSISEIYELILLIGINVFSTIASCFILKKLIYIFKKRIIFLLVNILFLLPSYLPILRKFDLNKYILADYITLILTILSFPITLLMVFITIRIHDRIQLKKYYAQIEDEYKKKYETYEKYSQFFEESKKFRHDLMNHLSVLTLSIDETNKNSFYNTAKENTESIIQDTRKISSLDYHSAPPVLNTLFAIKERYASEKNINIIYQISFNDRESISDYDLVGIISNLLDNAIEACEKIHDNSKKKTILLKIFNKNGFLCIDIANSINPEDNPLINNFKTSKKDSLDHGFGSHIIASIVKKHDGYFKIKKENEQIAINIALPNV